MDSAGAEIWTQPLEDRAEILAAVKSASVCPEERVAFVPGLRAPLVVEEAGNFEINVFSELVCLT